MVEVAQIDMTEVSVTPIFKYVELENIPQSEVQGVEVRRSLEVVEVHTAGSRNSVPVFPVDAQWKREGNRVITYAERWAEQYQAFKQGGPQDAMGTPLEMLRAHGIKPEHISLCKANKIYSIEALDTLSHQGVKALGMHANTLREAAKAFMAGKDGLSNALSEIETLKAQLAALTAGAAPKAEQADDLAAMKDEIERIVGARPRGNPSRETLERLLAEAKETA